MPSDFYLDSLLRDFLGDCASLNPQLPLCRKTLKDLLTEDHPHVTCGDGKDHFFKKGELAYLAGVIREEAHESLLLPIIIEVISAEERMIVRSDKGIEKDILSTVLDMPLPLSEGMVTLYPSQVGEIRKVLATTTQYVFRP